ncbi:glycosyltransferase family 4 protein [Ferrimicrobium acidiphilum]|jgi:glycosyltransferase involved in cell wall biosynthesis|uniref:glycosyltransferase family 4 protein n=1 Tax=Ferrimicrobium acidiphilum TaxID=121039 RepID=UPI0023EF95CD|nr:glycosyltransferase family 4 protein [Ferrimicrobium acidiphilum]
MQIVFEGNTRFDNSYGIVNLNLADALRSRGHQVFVNTWDQSQEECDESCATLGLLPFPTKPVDEQDVCIRQFWPPHLERPNARVFIAIQPWEFGGVPLQWVNQLDHVDQLWAYTNFVKSCWVESGVDQAKIHIVPLGVHQSAPRSVVKNRGQLLFLGGGIWRKGVDLFIQAVDGLSDDELAQTSVVIKESGVGSFYQNQSLVERFLAEHPRVRAVTELRRESMSRSDLDDLIACSHALVHPYRAEGFYLGGLEAMSLGTNVVMTRGGAGDDYANDGNAIMVDAVTMVSEERIDSVYGPIGGVPHWIEARVSDLTRAIREVLAPSDAMESRILAGHQTAANFSWDNSALHAERAIAAALTGDPPSDAFGKVEDAVDAVLTEWTAESLTFAVGLLIERHDFHGARELVACYAARDTSGQTGGLEASLDQIASGRVDLWEDAVYRGRIKDCIYASPRVNR